MEIHEKIKELRTKKRYSQYDMAELLGIGQSTYLQIEKGNTELTINRLYQIADVLEVGVYELLDFKLSKQDQTRYEELLKVAEDKLSEYKETMHSLNNYIKKLEIEQQAHNDSLDKLFEEIRDKDSFVASVLEDVLNKAIQYEAKKEYIDYVKDIYEHFSKSKQSGNS